MTMRNAFEGLATDSTLEEVKRGVTDYETRLDYAGRTDGNPVYVGKATQGAATSDAAAWVIQKLTYDTNSRVIRVEVKQGGWDGRSALF